MTNDENDQKIDDDDTGGMSSSDIDLSNTPTAVRAMVRFSFQLNYFDFQVEIPRSTVIRLRAERRPESLGVSTVWAEDDMDSDDDVSGGGGID